MTDTLDIVRPDDWHVHLRDDDVLRRVLRFTASCFGRGIIMPNLSPPVVSTAAAVAYRQRILDALEPGSHFTPLMTCYLTDDTDDDDLARGHAEGVFTAAKLYPAHATTGSAHGVTDVRRLDRVFERMERIGMPLLVHGESTDPAVDIFDREAVFIERTLAPLLARFEGLRVVLEHVTTEQAVDCVMAEPARLAATITPHHLMINRNAMFEGGLRPHHYCLPVAKRERHRLALRRAATSGDARFFLGTDTAPHPVAAKEADCGCAGIFNAPAALACYATVFDEEGALDRLEGFASLNGPRFYGLEPNEDRVVLRRVEHLVEEQIAIEGGHIRPFMAGRTLGWRVEAPA